MNSYNVVVTLYPSTFTSNSPMAYPACGGEYNVEGDGEVSDCPRPLKGRQLTVNLSEPFFLQVDFELLLFLVLVVVIGVVDIGFWFYWRVLFGLADYWLRMRVID